MPHLDPNLRKLSKVNRTKEKSIKGICNRLKKQEEKIRILEQKGY